MRTVYVGEICDLVNGRAFKPEDWSTSGAPIIRIQNLNDPTKSFNYWSGSLDKQVKVKPGDVLLAWSGTPGTSFGVHIWNREYGILNQHIFRVDLNRSKITPAWFRYAVNSQLNRLIAKAHGGVGLQHVTRRMVDELEIPLPPLPEQERIANILDKADDLRRKRRRSVELLNSLTQSIFLEMFGDPVTNSKQWNLACLGDVIHKASDGPHVSPEYSESGIPFLSARHIQPGRILWNDLKHITHNDAQIHWRKCRPARGDILYTKGGTTGLAVAVDTDRPFAIWVHVALLKTDLRSVYPEWLETMLNSDFCYAQSQRYTHGIANRDLGLKRMVKIQMYLPPMREQLRFVEARAKVLMSRHAVESASESQGAFYSSLQHRAFSDQF